MKRLPENKKKYKISNKRYVIFLLFLPFAFLLLSLSQVHAQTTRAFIVIPPKLELIAKPGEVIQDVIRIQNQTDEETTLSVNMSDFIVRDMRGTPELVDPATAGNWALSQWLSFSPQSLTIPPGMQGSVSVIISVPDDVLPGGRYATIYFSYPGTIEEGQTITGVATEIRSLVLLRIAGPISEEAIVRRFQAPRFSEFGPIKLVTEIANLGNYHIRPIGAISVKNVLGKTVATMNLEERNIFPGSSQEYTNTWEQKWLFGRFKATLTTVYGEQKLPLTATIFFWVWPWKITLAIVGIIILIVLLILLIKYLKGRKETKPEEIEEEEAKIEGAEEEE